MTTRAPSTEFRTDPERNLGRIHPAVTEAPPDPDAGRSRALGRAAPGGTVLTPTPSRRGRRTLGAMTTRCTLILALAVAGVAAFAPGGASAATYCVNAPTCPAGGIDKGNDLQGALDATTLEFGPDEVLVGDRGVPYAGPFVYPSGPVLGDEVVAIKASGPGRPVLTAGPGQTVLTLGGASLEGVDVRVASASDGVGIETGGSKLRDVRVTGPGTGPGAVGIRAFANTELDDVRVRGTGLRGLDARDGNVEADDLRVGDVVLGVSVQDNAKLLLTGSRVVAGNAALATRGNAIATSSVLETTDAGATGVSAGGGGLTLEHVTVAHRGPVNGQDAALEFVNVDIPGRANIGTVALAGYTRGVRRETESGDPYPVAIRDSVWDPSRDVLGNSSLGPFDESGNAHLAPALVDLAGGDFRPRLGSAAIDRDSLTGGRFTDLDDAPAADGDGDGSARADAGALEYRRRAPAVEATSVPSSGVADAPLAFAATGSDPDGDRILIAWAFGDGAEATGPQATHAYAAAGTYEATLRFTDEAGLTATRSFTVTIAGGGANGGAGGNGAPVLSSVRLSARSAKVKRARALRLRFNVSENATVRIAPRRLLGRRSVAARGAITRKAEAGRNSIALAKALKRLKLLRPGRLSLAVTAIDADGNRSKRQVVKLTLRR
jgi:hypothetical protein